MRLLDRKTVAVQVASQRKSQVDEGVAIATRVDKLRRTLGDLEAQQATFLSGMQAELLRKTQPLHLKIEALRSEIGDLEEKRRILLEPLDREWVRVKNEASIIHKKGKEIDERLQLLGRQETGYKLREKNLSQESKRVTREREVVTQNLEQAEQLRTDSERTHSETQSHRVSVLGDLFQQQKFLLEREGRVAAREREIDIEKKIMAEKEESMRIKEIQLNDRVATLERALTRLENNAKRQ